MKRAIAIAVAVWLAGCSTIAPGNNPLIVRCEQTQKVATATFQAVVEVDNVNRAFWQTNAPGFHRFCEWLRAPMIVGETNVFPRGVAMLWELDQVKLAYKEKKKGESEVVKVLATVEQALASAQNWLVNTKTTAYTSVTTEVK